eukprot:TRINITY_DN105468_c0_g1_i1.p1 TRINITY_DN105468_c0_g1~~TRINITY_DN105468_c0_g1_i1.p1  ORF type:complete len:290 (-),score=43.01 TRINITY_DN105468_c0_g1_i1:39-908(-)
MRACRIFLRRASGSARPGTAASAPALERPKEPRPTLAEWKSRASKQSPTLNLDEALYVAKMAGIYTTQEVQLQIVRSPPFSPREAPFTLENFFEVTDRDEGADSSLHQGDEEDGRPGWESNLEDEKQKAFMSAHPTIHGAIERYFRPDLPPKFWHNGEEWLARAEGRGTRKRASAHAVICRGTGLFRVNGEQDMYARWPQIYNRMDVVQPFKLTGTAGQYDVFVEVRGGGLGGQAGATRLAVARALLEANPACHDRLQRGFCLLEDTRQKMSKQAGRAGARKGFPWTKR